MRWFEGKRLSALIIAHLTYLPLNVGTKMKGIPKVKIQV